MARAASTASSSTHAAGTAAAVTPKGQATRASILQTAAAVFAERGYTDATLAELIARSGLTKGAFYFHFASKEQLALAVLEQKQRQWLEFVRLRALDKPRAIDQLRALGPALVRLHRQDPGAYSAQRLSRDLARIPELAGTIRAQMRRWIDLVRQASSAGPRRTVTSPHNSAPPHWPPCWSPPSTDSRTYRISSIRPTGPDAASNSGCST